jgi:hypothetical protein
MENNIVYQMADDNARGVLSKPDADIGKMSFIRADGNSVDGRYCGASS